MYRGRKFNSKKENVKGSEGKYLGIQRFRFYIKCSACSRPITFLTDPENADYEMETGGTRTYEVHKDRDRIKEIVQKEDAKSEKEDPMKALENRVLASQKEMADLDNLDEIKAMNMRHLKMVAGGKEGTEATEKILNAHHHVEEKDPLELDEEDEALVKSIKFGKNRLVGNIKHLGDTKISRLTEDEEKEMERRREMEQALMEKQQMDLLKKAQKQKQTAVKLNPLIKVKRKRKVQETKELPKKQKNSVDKNESSNLNASENVLGLLAGYGSDSDSD